MSLRKTGGAHVESGLDVAGTRLFTRLKRNEMVILFSYTAWNYPGRASARIRLSSPPGLGQGHSTDGTKEIGTRCHNEHAEKEKIAKLSREQR